MASGTIQGKAEFILSSFDVYIEGKPAVRQGDLMISNSKNTPPMPLNQAGGPMPRGLQVNDVNALPPKQNAKRIIIKIAGSEKLDVDMIAKG